MKCTQCGADINDIKLPCPECGHIATEQEGMDKIIKDILEEDEFRPTFEEVDMDTDLKESSKPAISKVFGEEKLSGETKAAKSKAKTAKTSKTSKATSASGKSKRRGILNEETRKEWGDTIVMVLRYGLIAVIAFFVITMYFNWFTLKGNAVNHGVVRTEEVQQFLYPGIENYSIERLDGEDAPIIGFSGMDLYRFGRQATEPYETIKGPSGADSNSIVSVIQKYYMQSTILMVIISVVCALLLLIPSMWGISIVRNLSVVNFFIIGLNYMALRIPFFSMFAVKAKDLLSQTMAYPELSMTMPGITMKATNTFYAYELHDERGFRVALITLAIWLFIGIVLTEVKNRRDEIAIEKGEI